MADLLWPKWYSPEFSRRVRFNSGGNKIERDQATPVETRGIRPVEPCTVSATRVAFCFRRFHPSF
jgi:hypothetical protein